MKNIYPFIFLLLGFYSTTINAQLSDEEFSEIDEFCVEIEAIYWELFDGYFIARQAQDRAALEDMALSITTEYLPQIDSVRQYIEEHEEEYEALQEQAGWSSNLRGRYLRGDYILWRQDYHIKRIRSYMKSHLGSIERARDKIPNPTNPTVKNLDSYTTSWSYVFYYRLGKKDIERANKKIQRIEENERLSEEKKEHKINRIANRKNLVFVEDYYVPSTKVLDKKFIGSDTISFEMRCEKNEYMTARDTNIHWIIDTIMITSASTGNDFLWGEHHLSFWYVGDDDMKNANDAYHNGYSYYGDRFVSVGFYYHREETNRAPHDGQHMEVRFLVSHKQPSPITASLDRWERGGTPFAIGPLTYMRFSTRPLHKSLYYWSDFIEQTEILQEALDENIE